MHSAHHGGRVPPGVGCAGRFRYFLLGIFQRLLLAILSVYTPGWINKALSSWHDNRRVAKSANSDLQHKCVILHTAERLHAVGQQVIDATCRLQPPHLLLHCQTLVSCSHRGAAPAMPGVGGRAAAASAGGAAGPLPDRARRPQHLPRSGLQAGPSSAQCPRFGQALVQPFMSWILQHQGCSMPRGRRCCWRAGVCVLQGSPRHRTQTKTGTNERSIFRICCRCCTWTWKQTRDWPP